MYVYICIHIYTYIYIMITIIRLVNISFTSNNYHFVVVTVRTFQIYSFSNFQLYNRGLVTIVTRLYIRSSKLIHHTTGSWFSLPNIIPFPPPPAPGRSLLFASMSSPFLDSTYIWDPICLSLTYFTDFSPRFGYRIIFPRIIP